MYDKVIKLLVRANIGSIVKDDILSNNLIKSGQDPAYYLAIKKILLSLKSSRNKERELIAFLKEY